MADQAGDPVAQDPSALFRGTDASPALRDTRTVRGTPAVTTPAFVLGEELADLADRDPRIVVLTADLASANRSIEFRDRHPTRFFDLGIAEKNMIGVAAGLASAGFIPYAATFAAFAAILGAEQIRTDCAYPGLPVRVIGHHAGISMGFYGTSHHANEDLAMMRAIPDLTVVAAADANALRAILRISVGRPGAMYIRLGRGRDPVVYPEVPANFLMGRALQVRDGRDLTIVATGTVVRPSLDAADLLSVEGISTRVLDLHTVKPFDEAAIRLAAAETGAILTVEEHSIIGGLGSAVAEVLVDATRVPFRRHGLPDEFALIGPPAALYAHYRLDARGIATVARELLQGSTGRL